MLISASTALCLFYQLCSQGEKRRDKQRKEFLLNAAILGNIEQLFSLISCAKERGGGARTDLMHRMIVD